MDYLVHYGVLGMHWGIRRYQPYSVVPRGSGEGGKEIGLAAKQKRNFKDIKKSYNKDKDPSRPYRMNDDTKKSIDNKIEDSGLFNSDDFKKRFKRSKGA